MWVSEWIIHDVNTYACRWSPRVVQNKMFFLALVTCAANYIIHKGGSCSLCATVMHRAQQIYFCYRNVKLVCALTALILIQMRDAATISVASHTGAQLCPVKLKLVKLNCAWTATKTGVQKSPLAHLFGPNQMRAFFFIWCSSYSGSTFCKWIIFCKHIDACDDRFSQWTEMVRSARRAQPRRGRETCNSYMPHSCSAYLCCY